MYSRDGIVIQHVVYGGVFADIERYLDYLG